MTLLFNTSFHIPSTAEADFKRWAKEEYIPAVVQSRLFSEPVVLKVLTARDEDEGETFCIQMFSSMPREAMKWLDDDASRLRNILSSRYETGKILHFTSSMLVVGGKES